MKSKMYLVQGMFFTEERIMAIGFDSEIKERAMMKLAISRAMFSGIIKLPEGEENGEGALLDHYGESILTNVKLSNENGTVTFSKRYNGRSDFIKYFLKRENAFWVGYYQGSATGKGAVRCILSPIDKEFFTPKGLEDFFN
jgi:hypothetical protein